MATTSVVEGTVVHQELLAVGAKRPPRTLRRLAISRLAGPVAALVTHQVLMLDPGLDPDARMTAAIIVWMAVWWATEAIPLPATALLPIVAFPLLGVLPIAEATSPYADPNIFLFIGGFTIALAIQRCGLHKRIALIVIGRVGTTPARLTAGFMVASAFLSMWISNSATTLMMLPIGLSVLALILRESSDDQRELGEGQAAEARNFAIALLLGIAYAASIGSLATLIGTPPNLILAAFVEQTYGYQIGFGQWMVFGLPLACVFLLIAWWVLVRWVYPSRLAALTDARGIIDRERAALGPMDTAQRVVLGVFATTAVLWVLRQPLANWDSLVAVVPAVGGLTDAGIAIAAAIALFVIPVSRRPARSAMHWETMRELPWGIVLLFGGGLSLAAAVQASGLDAYIGEQVTRVGGWPTVALVAVTAGVVLLMTEITSNTATAATLLPVLGAIAIGIGLDPLVLLVPAALAATCAFMLPVATPPNAIVFGSGAISIGHMMRAGVVLNVVGLGLVTIAATFIAPRVLGFS